MAKSKACLGSGLSQAPFPRFLAGGYHCALLETTQVGMGSRVWESMWTRVIDAVTLLLL